MEFTHLQEAFDALEFIEQQEVDVVMLPPQTDNLSEKDELSDDNFEGSLANYTKFQPSSQQASINSSLRLAALSNLDFQSSNSFWTKNCFPSLYVKQTDVSVFSTMTMVSEQTMTSY